jgi:multidrug efflux pump subunit AcrB
MPTQSRGHGTKLRISDALGSSMFNLASRARPYFGAIVLTTLLLVGGGLYAVTRMASGVYPEVTFPRIAVVAKKAGLDLRGMELQVTIPLEQAVSTVLGVSSVRTKTIRGGCDLSLEFAPGTDIKRAEQLTWNRIGTVRSSMPADVEFAVEQMTPSIFPVINVILTGGDNPSMLRDFAYYQLAPRIKNIPDVLRAEVAGGEYREIVVEVRPDDLLAAGLSAADLADQIGKAHRLAPVGRIEEPPFAFQILVDTQGDSARDIEDLVVSMKGNLPLRVRDVADVRVHHQDRTQSIGYQGRDAVVVTVFRRPGGNTGKVSAAIDELLAKMPKPANVQASVAYDQARFIRTAIDNVRDAILIGGLFSVLILLGFLRSWRATLISALAIPVTIAITFLFLYVSGETLNLMSLGGLAVAIGLVIDDTVVVIENIARHLAPGQSNRGGDAVDRASSEITGAVIGSTLTTVLVFVPLAFISGVYGQFFASLSWSLTIAVLVSMVISLTLVPVFAAKFLAGRPMPEPGPIYRALANVYEAGLGVCLRVPRTTLAVSLLAMLAGVVLVTGIPNVFAKREAGKPPPAPLFKGIETGLMPAMDEGAFILDYFAPTGTPLARTEEMARTLEHILSENPDVQSYVRRTGSENGMFATQTSRGDIQVLLRAAEVDPISILTKPERPKFSDVEKEIAKIGMDKVRAKYRRRPLLKIKEEIEDEVKEHFHEHQLRFEIIQIMQDELNDLTGASRPVEIKIFGPQLAELRRLAESVGEMLEKKGKGRGIGEVNNGVYEGNPDLLIHVDGTKAARLGIGADEIERQLRVLYFGQVATQVPESSLRMTDVRVRYPNAIRFGSGSFDMSKVREQWILLPDAVGAPAKAPGGFVSLSGPGRAVPVGAVADIEAVRSPDQRTRENQQPAIFVTAEINESEAGLGSVVADIRGWMNDLESHGDFPTGYTWQLGGHYVRMREAFESLALVMIVAILLVFIMLAFQFQSVMLPLLIFLTQPLSLASGLFALWITGTPLNVSSYMGAILLVGLDMKNGILLVECIQQLLGKGMELRPALLAAGRARFRPILMTSLAAILGLFPLALGIGPGAQMQQPLAIMVIGGLTANMLFTRMVIPVGYLVLEGRAAKPGRTPTTAEIRKQ